MSSSINFHKEIMNHCWLLLKDFHCLKKDKKGSNFMSYIYSRCDDMKMAILKIVVYKEVEHIKDELIRMYHLLLMWMLSELHLLIFYIKPYFEVEKLQYLTMKLLLLHLFLGNYFVYSWLSIIILTSYIWIRI